MSGLKDAFQGMREARPATKEELIERYQARRQEFGLVPGKPAAKVGKSAHPDFEPVKVYLRKKTHKRIRMQLLEAGKCDLSELVEELLRNYLGE